MTRLMVVLTALLALLFSAALVLGPADIGPVESLRALVVDDGGALTLVMREIRLPRAILAVLIGASLGMAGAAMQGYLRNPLADPGLIGVSGSAAFGAVLSIQTGVAATVAFALPLSALTGALVGVFLVLALALGGVLLASLARGLDALTLGEDAAEAMGIRLKRLRLTLVFGTAAVVGASTAVAGAIGFIGLVVPHIVRPFVGAKPGQLLWASALGGAIMLLVADIGVRVVLPGRDLKLGVLTALVGAPLFLHLIYKTRKEGL